MKNKNIDMFAGKRRMKRLDDLWSSICSKPLICFKHNESKAVSPLLSHSLFMAVGIVLLIFMSSLVWYIYTKSIEQSIKTELKQFSETLAGEIIKLRSLNPDINPEPNTSLLLGSFSIQLPDKSGGRSYTLTLYESDSDKARIVARAGDIEVEYPLYNLEIKMQGSDDGGAAVLEYYRYNFNGTIEDKITLGQPKILIAIEGIE